MNSESDPRSEDALIRSTRQDDLSGNTSRLKKTLGFAADKKRKPRSNPRLKHSRALTAAIRRDHVA